MYINVTSAQTKRTTNRFQSLIIPIDPQMNFKLLHYFAAPQSSSYTKIKPVPVLSSKYTYIVMIMCSFDHTHTYCLQHGRR